MLRHTVRYNKPNERIQCACCRCAIHAQYICMHTHLKTMWEQLGLLGPWRFQVHRKSPKNTHLVGFRIHFGCRDETSIGNDVYVRFGLSAFWSRRFRHLLSRNRLSSVRPCSNSHKQITYQHIFFAECSERHNDEYFSRIGKIDKIRIVILK